MDPLRIHAWIPQFSTTSSVSFRATVCQKTSLAGWVDCRMGALDKVCRRLTVPIQKLLVFVLQCVRIPLWLVGLTATWLL